MSERSIKRNIINILALFLMIVVLPGGSWYYLNAGMNYHKDLLVELKDYGKIPNFELTDQRPRTFNQDSLSRKVTLAVFINDEAADKDLMMERVFGLHDQFKHCDSMSMLVFADAKDNSPEAMLALKSQYKIKGNAPIHFLHGDINEIHALKKAFQIPDLKKGKDENGKYSPSNQQGQHYFILANKYNTICNYYDLSDSSIKKMVEHMSLIIARKVRKKPILNREKEK